MEYTIIRTRRKTIAAEIRNGSLLIRAPLRTPDKDILAFVQKHQAWIEKHLKKARVQQKELGAYQKLTMEDIRKLADQALQVIPERVAYYAPLVGVTYGRITIRNQKTKWGSCSSKGNLNFNCLLMLTPPEVIDSIVVHELCHRKEMNHSKKFYEEVLRVFPDYRKWEKWLKDNGSIIMQLPDLQA